MPTYIYKCLKCEHTFEVFARMSDEPPPACPKCEGPIERVIQAVGAILKGSGWYNKGGY